MYKRRIFLQGLAAAGALTLAVASPALASAGHGGTAKAGGPVSSVAGAIAEPSSVLQDTSALNGLVDSQPNMPGVADVAHLIGGPGSLGPGAAGPAMNNAVNGVSGLSTRVRQMAGQPSGQTSAGSTSPNSLTGTLVNTPVLGGLLGGLPSIGGTSLGSALPVLPQLPVAGG